MGTEMLNGSKQSMTRRVYVFNCWEHCLTCALLTDKVWVKAPLFWFLVLYISC